MTLNRFLLNETKALELCVIRDRGYIVATAWIDYEDIFRIDPSLSDRLVKGDEWGMLRIVSKNGAELEVPCHYIDI